MYQLDMSRMAELTTMGLLADKILLVIESYPELKNIPESNRPIFNLVRNIIIKGAFRGLDSVEKHEISNDTALAVSSYEIVEDAWWSNRDNTNANGPRDETRILLTFIEKACREIAETGQLTNNRDKEKFFRFFCILSEFTSKEHSGLLRRATKVEHLG